MDNEFLRSLFVQPPRVLGRQLKPLSAYHLAALMLLDSPFTTGGEPGIDDLVLAVWVCSHDSVTGPLSLFGESANADDRNPPAIEAWGKSVADAGGVEQRDFEWFIQYLNDYLVFGDVWQRDGGGGRESAVPAPFNCVSAVLAGMSGISRREAWDMPISELVGYKLALAEMNGAELLSVKQKAMIAAADQIAAAARRSSDGS